VCKISFQVKSLVLVQIDHSSHSFAGLSRAVDLGATGAKRCISTKFEVSVSDVPMLPSCSYYTFEVSVSDVSVLNFTSSCISSWRSYGCGDVVSGFGRRTHHDF
jgi:hypothetical protein